MTFPQFVYRNVVRNKRTYAAYFLSSAFSVLIFFVYALFIFHPDIKSGVTAGLAIQMMVIAEVLMYVFSFLFVLYSVSTFLKSRKHEFGILMMHGMTRPQLNGIVFLENMIIGFGAIIVGIAAGLLTGKLFLMVGSNMIGIEQLPFYFPKKAMGLTIGAFFILFLSISLFTTILVKSNKLIDLFQAGQKPKKEPKVSIVLSVFSALLLIVGYYLAATSTLNSIFFRMLPVIAMTVVGTYFFYTQLSVFLLRIVKRNRFLFLKKTNIVTISNLAYRLKDNARMFFMVTVVSTVAFCAVGALSSTKVLTDQSQVEYPAEISYLAVNDEPIHQENLAQIEQELKERGISYTSNQVQVKVMGVKSSTSKYPEDELVVIRFSDYKNIAQEAGYEFTEVELTGNEVVFIRQSVLEQYLPETYILEQDDIEIAPSHMTEHVVFPFQLIAAEGVVVSDEVYKKLDAHHIETFYGFYTKEVESADGMLDNLVEDGRAFSSEENPYTIIVRGTINEQMLSMYRMMFFVALLVGAVFFLAAGSFLYFRLYADLDYDTRQYLTIKKIGLTDQELTKIVTSQLALLFFVPIALAFVHSGFAFTALQSFYQLSIATEVVLVLAAFLVAQILYFFFIRYRYLKKLKKALI